MLTGLLDGPPADGSPEDSGNRTRLGLAAYADDVEIGSASGASSTGACGGRIVVEPELLGTSCAKSKNISGALQLPVLV